MWKNCQILFCTIDDIVFTCCVLFLNFQLKHCCVNDPSDLYTVNVSGQNLSDAVSSDFELFSNVVVVNASDNLLPLGLLKCTWNRKIYIVVEFNCRLLIATQETERISLCFHIKWVWFDVSSALSTLPLFHLANSFFNFKTLHLSFNLSESLVS